MNRKGHVGSMAPTSLPAVSYLSFQGVSCQRQQRDQVSRTSSNSLRVEQELFLHPEKKPQQPRISPWSKRFSQWSCGHCWQCTSPDSTAGEDLASCLSQEFVALRADKSLCWHLQMGTVFPRSAGLLWPASTFLSYLPNHQAPFLGIFSSRLLKLRRLAFQ